MAAVAKAAAAATRGAGAKAAAAALRGGCGTAARGWPRAGAPRHLCTAPGTAPDMKRYLWDRYREAKRSTDGECGGAPRCPSTCGGSRRAGTPGSLPRGHQGSGTRSPAQVRLLISRAPGRDPRSPPTLIAGDIASAAQFGETRKNALPETLQLLRFSLWERCFISYWDF